MAQRCPAVRSNEAGLTGDFPMRTVISIGVGAIFAIAAGSAVAGGFDKSKVSLQNRFVVIDTLTVDKGGWVVAHKSDNGKPGEIIGQAMIRAGTNEKLQVPITEQPEPGGSIIVMLHGDAGTMGTFKPDADKPLMEGGNPAMTEVKVE
jgi:hypothetical protein